MTVLAIRLYGGPMAAWGSGEAGDSIRPTLTRPGRGVILGLVAAALGYLRDDSRHADLARDLMVAVSAHGRRKIMREFRTVQTIEPGKGHTYISRRSAMERGNIRTNISQREYVTDGLWRVFIASRGNTDLNDLAASFRNPVFPLFLGRRDCSPSLPLDPVVINGNLKMAIDTYPTLPAVSKDDGVKVLRDAMTAIERTVIGKHQVELFWDEGFPNDPQLIPVSRCNRYDDPTSRVVWQFSVRSECCTIIPTTAVIPTAASFFDVKD